MLEYFATLLRKMLYSTTNLLRYDKGYCLISKQKFLLLTLRQPSHSTRKNIELPANDIVAAEVGIMGSCFLEGGGVSLSQPLSIIYKCLKIF